MDGLGVEPQQAEVQVDEGADSHHGDHRADAHLTAQQPAGQDGQPLHSSASFNRKSEVKQVKMIFPGGIL